MSTKQGSLQALTRVEMFPANWIGEATGNKPTVMKCKLYIGSGVNVMLLTTYKHINYSEFDREDTSTNRYYQNEITVKDYNGNPIQQYGIKSYLHKWNNQILEICLLHCRGRRIHIARIEHTEKDRDHHNAPQNHNGDNWHPPKPQNLSCCEQRASGVNSLGAAGPAEQAQCSRLAEATQTTSGQGYVRPNNNRMLSFFQKDYTLRCIINRRLGEH